MKIILALIFAYALAVFAEEKNSVAVLPSDASEETKLSQDELDLLTENMREAALKVLPSNAFTVLDQNVVIKRLGGLENYVKECMETSCIVNLGKEAQVDYVSQARVRRLSGKLYLSVNLYNVNTEGAVAVPNYDPVKSPAELLALVKKRVPVDVFGKIPGAVSLGNNEKENTGPLLNPMTKEPIKTSFWVAVGLDVLGAALIFAGYMKDRDMAESVDKYNVRGQSEGYYDDAWKKADDSRGSRNIFYIIGGVALASGIGVHIWF